ncbi:hypothetical protein TIFTF001_048938 [Ficus carica]|uniref:Uncharacterized protein n=1 Tax=Ficus carica TaxID=3494 RepID=A0AA88CM90_FICCA|nr:hypothetical protein TIFTF001_048935 [Ficus carica]GMN21850.1 hypothetical protein TIFTF001_048938 [Ficus carica]
MSRRQNLVAKSTLRFPLQTPLLRKDAQSPNNNPMLEATDRQEHWLIRVPAIRQLVKEMPNEKRVKPINNGLLPRPPTANPGIDSGTVQNLGQSCTTPIDTGII